MLDDLPTDEGETGDNRYVVLQKDIENFMEINNEDVSKKMLTKRTFIPRIRMKKMKFIGDLMRNEGLENVTLAGHIEIKGK